MGIMMDITVVLALAAVVLYVCLRLKIPTIVAFLVAGMLSGPHGLGLVTDVHEVELLAEVGVLLLLFTIGIEFSLEKLIASRRYIMIGGTLQVFLTILAFFGISMLIGLAWNQALYIGFLFCLSSTAIVLQLYQESNQIESFHGKVALSILIYQDIVIVPLILLLPWISGKGFELYDMLKLLAGIVIVVVVIVGSRKVMPRLISSVVHTRNRELFLLFILVVCFITAFLTFKIGLSLALGAFLAGLIISESEYSLEAMSSILPLKKIFTSIFFISVGMLLDLRVLISEPLLVISSTVVVMLVKIAIVWLVGYILKLPARSIWITAFSLFQVGEFAFILSQQGAQYNLLDAHLSQIFLSVSVISMGLSPFVIQAAPRIAAFLVQKGSGKKVSETEKSTGSNEHIMNVKDHVVIIGYGMNGRNVARGAREANIPYVIIDYNPETYKKERLKRENFIYGDASNHDTLLRANVEQARIAVVATHDPIATEMIVSGLRKMSANVRIIVRTRFMHELDILQKLGADEVIPEEFETSIEIFSRVMKYYLVPENDIDNFTDAIRKENYQMLRKRADIEPIEHETPFLSSLDIKRLRVPENSEWINRTLEDIGLRKEYNINAIAIERKGALIHNPQPDISLSQNDILVVIGLPSDIQRISRYVVKA